MPAFHRRGTDRAGAARNLPLTLQVHAVYHSAPCPISAAFHTRYGLEFDIFGVCRKRAYKGTAGEWGNGEIPQRFRS
jgi:hypothetical protein